MTIAQERLIELLTYADYRAENPTDNYIIYLIQHYTENQIDTIIKNTCDTLDLHFVKNDGTDPYDTDAYNFMPNHPYQVTKTRNLIATLAKFAAVYEKDNFVA